MKKAVLVKVQGIVIDVLDSARLRHPVNPHLDALGELRIEPRTMLHGI